jgi:tRNA-splicing endonuclease subunit Sen54
MHNALAFQRIHQPKNHTIATYHPKTNTAYAYNPKGPLFSRMGTVMSANDDPFGNDERRGQRIWLLPEEILYLIERGTVECRWPAGEDEKEGEGLPMSLQAGYAMFLGDNDGALTFERYSVYTALKRQGYTVLRAPSWNSPGPPPGPECYAPTPVRKLSDIGFLHPVNLWRMLFWSPKTSISSVTDGPVITPGAYRDYAEIYRRLSLIQYHSKPGQQSQPDSNIPETHPDFRITYHVYRPSNTHFKKSSPGPPDFRIAVVNGRETGVPTLQQLSALLDTTPYDPPKEDAQLYVKLRWGWKNVVLAVVDQGITSYLRIGDAVFGEDKLYERVNRGPGAKRGGGGRGGRGGGRGRGRGK